MYLWCRSKSRQPWKEGRGKIVSPAAHQRPIEVTICARPVSSSWTGVGLLGLVLLCQRTKSEEETLCSAFAVSMKIKTLKALLCSLSLTGDTTGASHIWQISWMTVLSTYDPQCNGVLKVEGRKKEATLTFMVYQPAVPWAGPEATYYLTGQTVCKRSPTHTHGSLIVRERRNCDKSLSFWSFCIGHCLACLGPK